MTAICTISGTKDATTQTVDFVQSLSATATAIVHSINLRHSNPVFIIPTPVETTVTVNTKLGSNTITINIGLVRNTFDISFELRDGPGDYSPFGTTNYEKLLFLSSITATKTLTLNGTELPGQIENMNLPYNAGQGNLILNGSFSFTLSKAMV